MKHIALNEFIFIVGFLRSGHYIYQSFYCHCITSFCFYDLKLSNIEAKSYISLLTCTNFRILSQKMFCELFSKVNFSGQINMLFNITF